VRGAGSTSDNPDRGALPCFAPLSSSFPEHGRGRELTQDPRGNPSPPRLPSQLPDHPPTRCPAGGLTRRRAFRGRARPEKLPRPGNVQQRGRCLTSRDVAPLYARKARAGLRTPNGWWWPEGLLARDTPQPGGRSVVGRRTRASRPPRMATYRLQAHCWTGRETSWVLIANTQDGPTHGPALQAAARVCARASHPSPGRMPATYDPHFGRGRPTFQNPGTPPRLASNPCATQRGQRLNDNVSCGLSPRCPPAQHVPHLRADRPAAPQRSPAPTIKRAPRPSPGT